MQKTLLTWDSKSGWPERHTRQRLPEGPVLPQPCPVRTQVSQQRVRCSLDCLQLLGVSPCHI